MNGQQIGQLLALAVEAPSRFRRFVKLDVNPQSGHTKRRPVFDPDAAARATHATIQRCLGVPVARMPHAFGAVPGRSPVGNLAAHRLQPSGRFPRFWYLTDISGAYPSVEPGPMLEAVLAFFPELEPHAREVDTVLRKHCFDWGRRGEHGESGGLYTGSPSSPLLFNIYCAHWLDARIAALGYGYTRYLDDLTLSSVHPISRAARRAVMDAIRGAGLEPSLAKTCRGDLRSQPVTVTGHVAHPDGRIGLTKRFSTRLRNLAHHAEVALDRAESGEFLLLPKRLMGSFGLLVGLLRHRDPAATVPARDLFTSSARELTATERSLVTRYGSIRDRIRALRPPKAKRQPRAEPPPPPEPIIPPEPPRTQSLLFDPAAH